MIYIYIYIYIYIEREVLYQTFLVCIHEREQEKVRVRVNPNPNPNLTSHCLFQPRCTNVYLRWTSIQTKGGVAILLVASCYRKCVQLWPCGPPVAHVRLYLYLGGQSNLICKKQ